jgi:hypothetical protein
MLFVWLSPKAITISGFKMTTLTFHFTTNKHFSFESAFVRRAKKVQKNDIRTNDFSPNGLKEMKDSR